MSRSIIITAIVASGVRTASGGVFLTSNDQAWQETAGPFVTIDFTGFEHGDRIEEQYKELGIHFVDGFYTIFENPFAFPNDGVGLDGNGDITVTFDVPMSAIAVDYPGAIQIELYREAALLYQSPPLGGGGFGFFAGLVSPEPFDMAIIKDPLGEAAIDDLHFGPPIPGPGGLALLALGTVARRRRRTSESFSVVSGRAAPGL